MGGGPMPLLTPDEGQGAITGALPAFDGLSVQVSAPPGTDTAGVPGGGAVVGWVLVADPDTPGGARIDPVFLAGGRAWTPDQYCAIYGSQFSVQVGRTR